MRYELLLRADDGLDSDQAGQLRRELRRQADRRLLIEWVSGADGAVAGVDLSIDPDDPEPAGELLCSRAFELAERYQLVLFDPQLGRRVERQDIATIMDRLARTASYVVSLRAGTAAADRLRRRGLGFWYALAAIIALIALVGQLSRCLI